MKRQQAALSPVVAAIILFTVTVAVSLAVATWMGAFETSFIFIDVSNPLTYPVPDFPNATHVSWRIGNAKCHNSTSVEPLPTKAWIPETGNDLILSVTYYQEIQPYWFKELAEVTYVIKEMPQP